MAQESNGITLWGRVFLRCAVEVVTGLHIGGSQAGITIGGMDNPVIRDALTGRPYLPGSSLKGKMRSLAERAAGAAQNWPIGQQVSVHVCDSDASYATCTVCPVFGVLGQMAFSQPTRLLVRDAFLTADSAARLQAARTDLPFTEVKWEAAIDRVTSAATPRQVERVPAGAVFAPAELVYTVYQRRDFENFRTLVQAMQLLEDDYLGGLGSRGGGKVRFTDLTLFTRARDTYTAPEEQRPKRQYPTLDALLQDLEAVIADLRREIPME
jgi:CRISPR-associated protein Csm3